MIYWRCLVYAASFLKSLSPHKNWSNNRMKNWVYALNHFEFFKDCNFIGFIFECFVSSVFCTVYWNKITDIIFDIFWSMILLKVQTSPLYTERKLNTVHETLKKHPGIFLNVLYTFRLRLLTRGFIKDSSNRYFIKAIWPLLLKRFTSSQRSLLVNF